MAQAGRLTGNADAQRVEIAELLAGIHPKNSTAFSANLHRWLKSHGRSGDIVYQLRDGTKLARVYGAGALFIGQPYSDYEGDTDFSGALLMQVLCMGPRVIRACFAGDAPALIEVDGFWDSYGRIGRCAIDPLHSVTFRDHEQRFHNVDGQLACKWCSAPVAELVA
ncbi:hypothetical protein [Pseudomonas violetae]|uniref:GNAT family N-acetyltransferase n=1 Tax=Pseudomonas violetae TaxID=2915813 RepID=A0ABT0ETD6_9PSED|nr:hypothetical protein [Pseudomonas violetae]MCK1788992.1 hypothetical protein [Pseudomonas violetae]